MMRQSADRMKRWSLHILAMLLALLCVVDLVGWMCSYRHFYGVEGRFETSSWIVACPVGSVLVGRETSKGRDGIRIVSEAALDLDARFRSPTYAPDVYHSVAH